jgi:hypothetical protein
MPLSVIGLLQIQKYLLQMHGWLDSGIFCISETRFCSSPGVERPLKKAPVHAS